MAAAVLLLHLGLFGAVSLALLQSSSSVRQEPPSAGPLTWLRLLPAPQATRSEPPARLPRALRPKPRQRPAMPTGRPPAALSWVPAAPPATAARPAAPAGPVESGTPAPASGTPAASADAPRPLVLTLPPGLPRAASAPWRNPALDDPRSNRLPATLESRLAAVMASSEGPITQEQLPDGSVRFRRGKSCVVARPSRSGSIDPFNQSVSPKPRQIDSC